MNAYTAPVERLGYVRGSSKTVFGPPIHKEWLHFCIFAKDMELLLNFSLMDDVRQAAEPGDELHRVVALLKENGGAWRGGVLDIPSSEARVKRGGIQLQYGDNRLVFEDGVFHLDTTLPKLGLRTSLKLTPKTKPLLRLNTPLQAGDIHWFVLPRLSASGTVWIDDVPHRLKEQPAYHDHNWGRFLWGHDFGWQWGFGLSDTGPQDMSVVLVRLVNRARTQDLGHGLFIWRGDGPLRTFREGELNISPIGLFRRPAALQLPPVMALLNPGTRTDVPSALSVLARSGEDRINCTFFADDVVQIHIPSETDLSTVTINEVSGGFSVKGEVAGEKIEFSGKGYFEYLT